MGPSDGRGVDFLRPINVGPKEIAETVVKDPPVAARVLGVANSAAYGFPNKVDSVILAVGLMGVRETYSIVLSAAVLNLFDKTRQFNYQEYWEEAMNCAAAARIIADLKGSKRRDCLFTAGLLHDIGRIALLETAPKLYVKISHALSGEELVRAEEEIVGLSHTEAGYELAQSWGLPSEIAQAIRYHHQPEDAEDHLDVVATIALAEAWSRLPVDGEIDKEALIAASSSPLNTLGITPGDAGRAFDEIANLERVRFSWNSAASA